MPRKLAAAFFAALLALSAMPLIASPASAHDKRTQRCDYDPISGQNFNCRSQYVPHSHPKPPTQGPETSSNANPDSSGNLGDGGDGTGDDGTGDDGTGGDGTGDDGTGDDGTGDDGTGGDGTGGDGTGGDGTGDDGTGDDGTGGDGTGGDGTGGDGTGDDGTGDDGTGGDDGGHDQPVCPSGTFVAGNCQPRTTTTTTDPCGAWMSATRDALHNSRNPTPPPDGCGTDISGALTRLFTRIGDNRIENAAAREQAFEELRRAIKEAWDYEIPYVDDAVNTANCVGLGIVFVRSRGTAAKVPGFTTLVSAAGCGTYISKLTIDTSDSDGNSGGSNGGSSSDGGSDGDGGSSSGEYGDDGDDETASEPERVLTTLQDVLDAGRRLARSGRSPEALREYQEIRDRYYCDIGAPECPN